MTSPDLDRLTRRLHALEVAASAMMDALSNYYQGRGSGAAPTDEIERAWNALWTARWGQ